jgi:hypothetical protein
MADFRVESLIHALLDMNQVFTSKRMLLSEPIVKPFLTIEDAPKSNKP